MCRARRSDSSSKSCVLNVIFHVENLIMTSGTFIPVRFNTSLRFVERCAVCPSWLSEEHRLAANTQSDLFPTSFCRQPFRVNFSTGPRWPWTQRAHQPAVITPCKWHLGPFNTPGVVSLQLVRRLSPGTHLWSPKEGRDRESSVHSFSRYFHCFCFLYYMSATQVSSPSLANLKCMVSTHSFVHLSV